jgi:NhaP-type Na+/H+ and K+/H+ antiporter
MSTLHKTIIFLYLGLPTCVNRVYPIKFEIKDITYTVGALGTLILCLCSSLIVLPNVDQYIMADLFYRM